MGKEEREAIASFMYAMLQESFPNWREYPLWRMAQTEHGDGFEGTEFENHDHLIRAYYAVKAWKFFIGKEIEP